MNSESTAEILFRLITHQNTEKAKDNKKESSSRTFRMLGQ